MTPAEKLRKYLRSLGPHGIVCIYSATKANGGVEEYLTAEELKNLFLNVVYHGATFKEVWANKAFSPHERAAVYQNLMTAIDEIDALFNPPEARNDISD